MPFKLLQLWGSASARRNGHSETETSRSNPLHHGKTPLANSSALVR
jgi:hypothetical protein